jgi:hypothetical protein
LPGFAEGTLHVISNATFSLIAAVNCSETDEGVTAIKHGV